MEGNGKMPTTAKTLVKKSLTSPDETRPFVDKGKLELVNFESGPVGLATVEPGWRWSEHVKPVAKPGSGQAAQCGALPPGRRTGGVQDGAGEEWGPGDVGCRRRPAARTARTASSPCRR